VVRSKVSRTLPIHDAFDLSLRFLLARRAQNLSYMRVAEQSLRSLAAAQQMAGPGGASLARLWTAYAGFVRDSARVYKLLTAHFPALSQRD
jgi:hypothetical protein